MSIETDMLSINMMNVTQFTDIGHEIIRIVNSIVVLYKCLPSHL